MAEPIRLAVVGHTNAGKTSLLRTLTRRSDFGAVSPLPGTTRQVETVDLAVDGQPQVRFADTPGLEDPVGLLELIRGLPADLSPAARLRAFLARPEALTLFEQEAKVLRVLASSDAALYVIDSREPVLPKHRCEVELLQASARPLMPVLNFLRATNSRHEDWRRMLAEHGLHVQAGFDAVAPFVGAESRLYQDLATLLGEQRERLDRVRRHLEVEQTERRTAALRSIADHLVGLAAHRVTLPREVVDDPARRQAAVDDFRGEVLGQARHAADELLRIHGFRPDEAELAGLGALTGRWDDDLFSPAVLGDAARRLGTGAAVGATIGLGLDLALAGLSLGAAAALGATIGSVASQGFGPVGRVLARRLRGELDLTLDDEVLLVLADRLLRLLAALGERGHAAQARLPAAPAAPAPVDPAFVALLRGLNAARGRPDWALGESRPASSQERRHALVEGLLPLLEAASAS